MLRLVTVKVCYSAHECFAAGAASSPPSSVRAWVRGRSRAKLLVGVLSVRDEGGQVLVLAAVGMIAICAMAGLAIDVGVWYQAHRKQQSIADASALAAGGQLPSNTSQASADAQTYAAKNGGSASSIAFSTTYMPSDTVTVEAQTTVPSYFLGCSGSTRRP